MIEGGVISMLIELKNAQMAGRDFIEISHSKFRQAMGKLLAEEGLIREMRVFKKDSFKKLHLGMLPADEFQNRRSKITLLKIYSKPGRRLYYSVGELSKLLMKGHRKLILSTSRGLMMIEEAEKRRLGGEAICEFL